MQILGICTKNEVFYIAFLNIFVAYIHFIDIFIAIIYIYFSSIYFPNICLATNTPLAEACESECVTPLPSPITYKSL